MGTLDFLAALPAILAITGFVVYRFIIHQNKSIEITKNIVAKLREKVPDEAERIEELSPSEMTKVLKRNHELRTQVSEYDFELLKKVAHQEFIRSLVVYGTIALLFLAGVSAFVYLQIQPKPVEIESWNLESQNPKAKGVAVDLDDLKLTWKAEGPSKDMSVFIENIDTKRRSETFSVSSDQQELFFPKGSYDNVLKNRKRGTFNRVRAIASTDKDSYTSQEFHLHVGIKVMALRDKENSSIWVTAMIDNASINNYNFEAKVLVWTNENPRKLLSFGGKIENPKTEFSVPDFNSIYWSSLKVIYFGPDDNRFVRVSKSI